MKVPGQKEQRALERVLEADREESWRGQFWSILPLQQKALALHFARIPKARAAEPLANFTPEERSRMFHGCMTIAQNMEVIARLTGLAPVAAPSKKLH